MRGDAAPVDARSLGARVGGGADGPKVINLRSLRERGAATGGSFVGRADGLAPARGGFVRHGGAGAPRFGGARFGAPGGGAGAGSAPRFGGARFGAPGGASSGNNGRTGFGGARGSGRGRGGGARSGRGGARGDRGGKKKDDRLNDKPVDREWSNQEMEVLDRLDQGELTPYTPQATLEGLLGFGPAIATDNTLGKMESALRSMRMMGGGQAFDNDPAGTVDTKAIAKRYLHDKKPIFFNTKQEKEWLELSMKGMKIAGVVDPIKQAVLETTVMGKYRATEFKEIKDVAGTMANYHSRDASYRASHSLEFTEKVLSILPNQVKGGSGKAARA